MHDTAPEPFASILRRFRRAANLTQEQLAERAALSVRTVSDLERGLKHSPQGATIRQLADALALSPEDRRAMITSVPRRRHVHAPTRPPAGDPLPSLPADLTPLVGREHDEAAAIHLLHTPGVRLLTLTGPGGCGKTRLALRIAATLSAEYGGHVGFVPLAPVATPETVPAAIAAALTLRLDAALPPQEGLTAVLRGRRLLLVLDNFEHLAPAAIGVSNLLTACAELTVLATSRTPLHLRGEHLLDVPPLDVPDGDLPITAETALGYSAVALFVQRAQAVRPDFALNADIVPAIGAICRRLDGLPLALELAAAQIRHMPPTTLLERLRQSIDSLPPGPIDAPPRQQSIHDAIAWSYDLLTHDQQLAFRAISVFVGSCTAEAASAISPASMPALLAALVEASLLTRGDAGNTPRFALLQTVRDYSVERARAHGEETSLRDAHARYFAAVAHEAAAAQLVTGPSASSDRLRPDHHNIRAAVAWLTQCGRLTEALQLAADLMEYWLLWGELREGRETIDHLLSLATDRGVADIPVDAVVGAARLAWFQTDYPRAERLYEEGAAIHRRLGNIVGESTALSNIGTVAHVQNQYGRASTYYAHALDLARAADDPYRIAIPLTNLGIVAMQEGDYPRAEELLDEAISMWRQIGNDQRLAVTLGNRGNLAFRRRHYHEAARLHEEALAMKRAVGDRPAIAYSLGDLALDEIERHDYARAVDLLDEALHIFDDTGLNDGIVMCLEALARIAHERGDLNRAVRLYAGAAALRSLIGISHHPADMAWHEERLNALRTAMPAERYRENWSLGETLPLTRLVAEALSGTR